jgi:hypothetical protein
MAMFNGCCSPKMSWGCQVRQKTSEIHFGASRFNGRLTQEIGQFSGTIHFWKMSIVWLTDGMKHNDFDLLSVVIGILAHRSFEPQFNWTFSVAAFKF